MSDTLELEAPVFLLAMPQVLDPFFHKSVVLLVHHEPDGSLGFIVNRPTSMKISEVLEGLEIPWQGDQVAPAHLGGPVQQQLGTVIYHTESQPPLGERGPREICPGVGFTQHVGDLELLAKQPPPSFKLLLGFAQWGEGQLQDELMRNDWLTAPYDADLVFDRDHESVWASALASVGVDPAQLPSWTPSLGDVSAN